MAQRFCNRKTSNGDEKWFLERNFTTSGSCETFFKELQLLLLQQQQTQSVYKETSTLLSSPSSSTFHCSKLLFFVYKEYAKEISS
ncbi:hypothetical protein AQUCO_02000567v1 [Aquilegia coerulea]|uniref:Uncharacterized protein n=1 Tax=Aquilegia coerulea TaxID=218851 RepID=A0A2G5DI69_AQUCA|nr:hypothetical protein AQUCO_02000567v1 [Aquilegia coerulea]